MEHIRLEIGTVSRVVLNRPAVRNAMSDQTLRELSDSFARIASHGSVRAVVVTGEGQDFCAGADIEWMRRSGQLSAEEGQKDARLLAEMLRAVSECPAPVIVAAHGSVFGGGLGLVASCDIALLGDGVKMSFSECRLGIVPAVISSWVLPKIGAANARRYYLTAEVFGAKEAVAMGLASEVVAGGGLAARADALCREILKNSPEAVREAKALIAKMPGRTLEESVELTVETLVRLRSSPEGQEGLSAFLERRIPKWTAKP